MQSPEKATAARLHSCEPGGGLLVNIIFREGLYILIRNLGKSWIILAAATGS